VAGIDAEIFSVDLSAITPTQSVIPAAIDRFWKVDIFVNNAAVFAKEV
jgi:short-subunit dehydrogenase